MGKLLVLEGTDGAGKTTQADLLIEYLRLQGLKVETVSFPSYDKTVSGRMVARYLSGEFGDLQDTNPYLISYLYAADRFEHQQELASKMAENDIVIATRYAISNMAYQSAKLPQEQKEEFRKWCLALDYEVFKLPKEDAVIFLSVPPHLSNRLLKARKENAQIKDIHEDAEGYMVDVWQEYLRYCKTNPNCFVIHCFKGDEILSKDAIATQVQKVALENLK